MRAARKLWALILCLACWQMSWRPHAALASEALMSPYLESGGRLLKSRNYADAERQLEMALENAEHLKPDAPRLIELYESLGQAAIQTGHLARAEEVFAKALNAREKSPKKDQLKLFGSLMMLGTVYRDQGKFADSEILYKRGLAMFEGQGPVKTVCRAAVLLALGTLYVEMNRPAEAETLLRKALELKQSSLLGSVLKPAVIYDSLGRSLSLQGKNDEAVRFHKLAIEAAGKEKDAQALAFAESNLATVYVTLGKYAEARALFESSIKSIAASHGPESNEAATCYSNLALVAVAQDRYDEAESLIYKALAVHEKNLGPEHYSVGYDLSKLVDIYRNQGKYDQAGETAARTVSIFTKSVGRNSIATGQSLTTLASVQLDQGQFDRAQESAREALEIIKARLGAESAETVPPLVLLSSLSARRGDLASAIQLLEQTRAVLEKAAGADQAVKARVLSDLAFHYRQVKEPGKSEAMVKEALSVREKLYGTGSQRLLGDLGLLSALYADQGRQAEQAAVDERIADIRKSHPELATAPKANESPPIVAAAPSLASRDVKDKWALVIGISNFADPALNLKFAAKDAVDFSNFLVREASFAPDHVKVLTDRDATRENIIKQLGDGWLGRLANRDDLVVIYISSHGSTAKSEAGGVNFLVAHDTAPDALLGTGIPMQWLSQIIREQVHSNRVVLILDVCHSGAASDGRKGLSRTPGFDPSKVEVGAGQAIICSSSPDQVSWESKENHNSVFTYRLIESLRGDKTKVDLNQAFETLRERVESEVLRDRGVLQTPVLFSKQWYGPPPVLSVAPSSPRPGLTTK